MGCGGSKDGVRVAPKGAVAVRIGTKPVVSSQQNDMSVEDVDDYNAGVEQPASLLTSWNTPTQNAAHARIIRTVSTKPGEENREAAAVETSPEVGAPRQRTRAAKHDEEPPATAAAASPEVDSSDDEDMAASPPGMVSSNPSGGAGVLGMFRPRTPHAVMDLD